MTMWSLSVGLILFTLLPVYLNAVTLTFRTKPGPLNYVRLGDTLKLNVTYDFDGNDRLLDVIWYFGIGHAYGEKVKKSGNYVQTLDDRATIEGQASLVLENTTVKDNTTFTVRISSFGVPNLKSSFQVIIQVKPDALTDCNQNTEINQGENVACRCYSTKKGNPPHTACWYKDGRSIGEVGDLEKTLSLNNVTVKDNGTYICRLQSHDLINETFVHVLVTFKPESVEFSSDKTNNVVLLRNKVVIKCVADGYPTPTYTISLNGTDLTTGVVDGVKTIEKATYKDAGLYECVAENKIGKDSSSFTLHVQAKPESVEFSSDKTNNVVLLRNKVVIKCVADGYPTPTYTISLNGTDLTTGVVDGVKTIEKATYKDAGLYECVAENKIGKDSSSFTLHVQVVSTPMIQATTTLNDRTNPTYTLTSMTSSGPNSPSVSIDTSVTVVTSRPSTFSSSLLPNLTTTSNDRTSASVIDVTATYSFTASSSSSIKTKSNDSDTDSSPDELSTAKIAWITCGVIVALLFLLILIYVCVKRPNQDTLVHVCPKNTTDNVKLRDLNEQESPPQKQEEQEQTNKFSEEAL